MNKIIFKNSFYVMLLLGLTGCYEVDFRFQTTVSPDGKITRHTTSEGRGADNFKAPEGSAWKVTAWESKGQATLLPDAIHHFEAHGQFKINETIPSDYCYNTNRAVANWSDEDKAQLEKLGVKAPYEETFTSCNQIKVKQAPKWFSIVTTYEETFENKGIIQVLLADLKEEVVRQAQKDGEALKAEETDILARLRIEEMLSEIRFQSELKLPGKIISSNAKDNKNGILIWKFSLKDFEEDYSRYTLKASSRTLRWPVIAFCILLILAILLAGGIVFVKQNFLPHHPSRSFKNKKSND